MIEPSRTFHPDDTGLSSPILYVNHQAPYITLHPPMNGFKHPWIQEWTPTHNELHPLSFYLQPTYYEGSLETRKEWTGIITTNLSSIPYQDIQDLPDSLRCLWHTIHSIVLPLLLINSYSSRFKTRRLKVCLVSYYYALCRDTLIYFLGTMYLS